MTTSILFVDDNIALLRGIRRQLYEHFTIETAPGGEEGLETIRSQGPFAVIVSDMRMPGMNGAQFLANARECTPESVRLLLTGQADMESAIAAVNEGHIFRFLTKPCLPETLISALEAALKQYNLITAERTLLEQTLHKSVKVLTDVLSLISPLAFGRAARLKHYAKHIAIQLDLPDRWQIELAAMLSQLGCVTLSMDLLEKEYAAQTLSPAEAQKFAAHPAVGHELLSQIPRLETMAAMVAKQQEPYSPKDMQQPPQQRDQVALGAHILKVALAFDRLLSSGHSVRRALAALCKQCDAYDPLIVKALDGIDAIEVNEVVQLVTVRELCPGMVLREDIQTSAGILVIAKGHEITGALMERLRTYAKHAEIVEPFRCNVKRYIG